MAQEIQSWRRFLTDHADLYDPGQAWAQVGIVAFGEQEYFSGERTQKLGLAWLAGELIEGRVLFDMIHEDQWTRRRLKRYRVTLIPPGVRYVSQTQLDTLLAHVAGGGKVIMFGDDFARFDERCRRREGRPTDVSARMLDAQCDRDVLFQALTEGLAGSPDVLDGVDHVGIEGVGVNAFAMPSAGEPEQGDNHASFKLSAGGETVALYDTDGTTLLDSIDFGE